MGHDWVAMTGAVKEEDVADDSPCPETVVAAALVAFARLGFAETKLDALAKDTGMTKRMIHYHFGDKKGLYQRCLRSALELIAPPADILNRSHAVPVEGMRRFVDALYFAIMDHPDAVRLVIRDNLDPILSDEEVANLPGATDVTLHVERLLLAGQDAGAFRPGISAQDVLVLISSLCFFRVGNSVTALNVGHVDVERQRNVEGMRRLVIDTVLAFLTSNIPDSGYESYLETTALPDAHAPADELYDLYGDDGGLV